LFPSHDPELQQEEELQLTPIEEVDDEEYLYADNRDNGKGKRVRNYIGTLNNYTAHDIAALSKFNGTEHYICFGEEISESGTPHLQAFIRFKTVKSVKAAHEFLASLVTTKTSRWGLKRGDNNVDMMQLYVRKGLQPKREWTRLRDAGPNYGKDAVIREYGKKPRGQGKRTDLHRCCDMLAEGYSIAEVALANPTQYVRYHAGLEKFNVLTVPRRDFYTLGYWVHGPAGVKKSVWAAKHFDPETVYFKPESTKWWPGYDPKKHTTVIWNDFRYGQGATFAQLLNLLDQWPMYVENKGVYIPFRARRIIFTCTKTVREQFEAQLSLDEGSLAQLARRLRTIPISDDTIGRYCTFSPAEEDHYLNKLRAMNPSESAAFAEECLATGNVFQLWDHVVNGTQSQSSDHV